MSHILALALMAGSSVSMPQAFQGGWFEPHDAPSCAVAGEGNGTFQIDAKTLEDPLGEYEVTGVHVMSPTSVHVMFVYRIADQNISKKGSAVLTLKDNGTRLVGAGDGDLAGEYISGEFVRCTK